MVSLVIACALTLAVSFVCSLCEALILSTTVAEVEGLKRSHRKRGELLEQLRANLDGTISAILTLNTMANAFGSAAVGAIGASLLSEVGLGVFMACFGVTLLIGSEVLPKTIGFSYRKQLQPLVAFPLWLVCRVFRPVSYVCNRVVRLIIQVPESDHQAADEIALLAQRAYQQGNLQQLQANLISNAVSLDQVRVGAIMTPRTVVTSIRKSATVADVLREFANMPFARMPVYGRNLDDVVGVLRRRDLLKAKAAGQDNDPVEKLMQEVHFIPDTVTAAAALLQFLKTQQQMMVVVDEFGSMAGVISMEDVTEQILGQEIFEKDDLAVDMRELARARQAKLHKGRRFAAAAETPKPPASAPGA
ncbi:CNNM domain-containing protein [Nibricoccus sp. IMCC34717]|uniref:CNNM domain-containing protein n=1 Tax=Nibricoccus sp. IMCC34717 TaxID=3034021 RepID=UPI0038516420